MTSPVINNTLLAVLINVHHFRQEGRLYCLNNSSNFDHEYVPFYIVLVSSYTVDLQILVCMVIFFVAMVTMKMIWNIIPMQYFMKLA